MQRNWEFIEDNRTEAVASKLQESLSLPAEVPSPPSSAGRPKCRYSPFLASGVLQQLAKCLQGFRFRFVQAGAPVGAASSSIGIFPRRRHNEQWILLATNKMVSQCSCGSRRLEDCMPDAVELPGLGVISHKNLGQHTYSTAGRPVDFAKFTCRVS